MNPEKNRTPLTARSPAEREVWADELLDRLTPAMSALSVVFELVVVGESMASDGTGLSVALIVAGWLIWLAFLVEFSLGWSWPPTPERSSSAIGGRHCS